MPAAKKLRTTAGLRAGHAVSRQPRGRGLLLGLRAGRAECRHVRLDRRAHPARLAAASPVLTKMPAPMIMLQREGEAIVRQDGGGRRAGVEAVSGNAEGQALALTAATRAAEAGAHPVPSISTCIQFRERASWFPSEASSWKSAIGRT